MERVGLWAWESPGKKGAEQRRSHDVRVDDIELFEQDGASLLFALAVRFEGARERFLGAQARGLAEWFRELVDHVGTESGAHLVVRKREERFAGDSTHCLGRFRIPIGL